MEPPKNLEGTRTFKVLNVHHKVQLPNSRANALAFTSELLKGILEL